MRFPIAFHSLLRAQKRTLNPTPPFLITDEIKFGAMYEEEAGKPIDRAASFGSEAVDSIKTVAAFGQELQILRTLTKLSEPNHKQRNRLAFAAALFFGLSQAIPCVIVALIYFYGGKRYADGSDNLTTVYALFEACMIASFALSRIFSFSGDFCGCFWPARDS